jgi:MFS family permease
MLRSSLPDSRDARRVLTGNLFSAVGNGLTLPFLFVYLTEVRGLDGGQVGLLVGWMGLVALITAPAGGALVDRLGARPVMLTLFVLNGAGAASLALVHSLLTAFVSVTVIAIAGSTLWAGQTTILTSLVTPQERQRTFALSFALMNLGLGVGGIISGSFVDTAHPGTFQTIYVVDGLAFLIPLAVLLSLPRVGRRLVDPAPESTGNDQPQGYGIILRDKTFLRFVLFGLLLTTFGYAQIEVGFTGYSVRVAQVAPHVLGWAFGGNTLLIVVAQLWVSHWLEGRSRTHALATAAAIFSVSWIVLAIAGVAGTSGLTAAAVVGVVACSVIFAVGETLMSPTMPAITNALATDEVRGRYNAIGSMVWGVSGIIGPVVAGPLIAHRLSSVWITLVILGCVGAAAMGLRLHHYLTAEQDGRAPAADTTEHTELLVGTAE